MSDRSKVGKGNRKLVREHFRNNGVEFEFGRDCVNGRYSFKPGPGFVQHTLPGSYDAMASAKRQNASLSRVAETCPVPVEVVLTKRTNGYCNRPQFNNAVRFVDA
jgi:hypothetical protein